MKNREFLNTNVDAPGPLYTMRELRIMRTPLTQEQAAALIGVSVSCISKWERQESFPNVRHIPKIEQVYGIDIHSIDFSSGDTNIQTMKDAKLAAYYRSLKEEKS